MLCVTFIQMFRMQHNDYLCMLIPSSQVLCDECCYITDGEEHQFLFSGYWKWLLITQHGENSDLHFPLLESVRRTYISKQLIRWVQRECDLFILPFLPKDTFTGLLAVPYSIQGQNSVQKNDDYGKTGLIYKICHFPPSHSIRNQEIQCSCEIAFRTKGHS